MLVPGVLMIIIFNTIRDDMHLLQRKLQKNIYCGRPGEKKFIHQGNRKQAFFSFTLRVYFSDLFSVNDAPY